MGDKKDDKKSKGANIPSQSLEHVLEKVNREERSEKELKGKALLEAMVHHKFVQIMEPGYNTPIGHVWINKAQSGEVVVKVKERDVIGPNREKGDN